MLRAGAAVLNEIRNQAPIRKFTSAKLARKRTALILVWAEDDKESAMKAGLIEAHSAIRCAQSFVMR
jgi:hypothetical protein